MSSRSPAKFEQKAIELVTTQRKSVTQVSLEVGVCKPTLCYWLNHQGQGSTALNIERPFMDPAQQNKRLRSQLEAIKRENIQLRAERDDTKEENRAAISCSLYLVRKVMKFAGFFWLPKKRKYPKGNYSPEIENLIKGNFQSAIPHEKWFTDITQKIVSQVRLIWQPLKMLQLEG